MKPYSLCIIDSQLIVANSLLWDIGLLTLEAEGGYEREICETLS